MKEFLLGALFGICVLAMAVSMLPSFHKQAKGALEECEKSLPRDQKCKVIAIPEIEPIK